MSKYWSGNCEDKSAELRLPLRSPIQCHFALISGLLWVLWSEPLKALVSLHQYQIWKQHLAYSWILREGYTENRKCEIMVWATALPVTCVGINWLLSLQATFYKTLIGNLLSASQRWYKSRFLDTPEIFRKQNSAQIHAFCAEPDLSGMPNLNNFEAENLMLMGPLSSPSMTNLKLKATKQGCSYIRSVFANFMRDTAKLRVLELRLPLRSRQVRSLSKTCLTAKILHVMGH